MRFQPIIFLSIALIALTSCDGLQLQPDDLERNNEQDKKSIQYQRVNTDTIYYDSLNSAIVMQANFEEPGDAIQITDYGFCWSKKPEPTLEDKKLTKGKYQDQSNPVSERLEEFCYETVRYIRPFAEINKGEQIQYGEQINIQLTNNISISQGYRRFSEFEANTALIDSVKIVNTKPFLNLQEIGVCWAKNEDPTVNNSRKVLLTDSTISSFKKEEIKLFKKNKVEYTFYFRVYYKDKCGIHYSENKKLII